MTALPTAAVARAPAPNSPRKALHLAARERLLVSAAGESLVVRRDPAGRQMFPLTRIDRVICNRNAQWTGEALLLCLAHGITLTWVDGRGRAVGAAAPVRTPAAVLSDRIDIYLERPEWVACYANWLRCRRMTLLHRWAEEQRAAGHPPDMGKFESLKRAYVYGDASAGVFDDAGAGWCHALTLAHLGQEGLDPRYWGDGGRALELCDDMARLLWAQFSLGCGALPGTAQVPAVKLLFFEHWTHTGRRSLLEHLADLHRHIARVIH